MKLKELEFTSGMFKYKRINGDHTREFVFRGADASDKDYKAFADCYAWLSTEQNCDLIFSRKQEPIYERLPIAHAKDIITHFHEVVFPKLASEVTYYLVDTNYRKAILLRNVRRGLVIDRSAKYDCSSLLHADGIKNCLTPVLETKWALLKVWAGGITYISFVDPIELRVDRHQASVVLASKIPETKLSLPETTYYVK